MQVCPRCGKLNSPEVESCTHCWQPLTAAASSQSPAPQQPADPRASWRPPVMAAMQPEPQTPFGAGSLAQPPQQQIVFQLIPCLVCGTPVRIRSNRGASCPRCRVPVGSVADPNDITCSTALPFTGKPVELQPTTVESVLEGETWRFPAKWNWGAAILSVPWCIRHKCWGWTFFCILNTLLWIAIELLYLIPIHGDMDSAGTALAVLSVLFWIIKTFALGSSGGGIAARSGLYTDDREKLRNSDMWASRAAIVGGIPLALIIAQILWLVSR